MASFADQISQFNPYVQQLPIEAMAQVGMYKQQKYDEGVQKIQSYINNVAGLEVLRDVDKQYLQSKLNELGNKLKIVAAGDFSNYQLVNSVGGMATQIVKDPIVKAAVKSTADDKKNLEQIDNDRKTGKLAPENEYFYGLQRRKYLQSGLTNDDGSPINFSGYYTPFRDVYSKLRGIAKDVGVDEAIVQNLFNPDGSVNKVMIETTVKGKDVDKIYDAFVNGLDEGDYQQLMMTGAYKYRGSSPSEILSTLEASNNQYITTVQAKKADLETRMVDLKDKLVSAKPEEAKMINQQLTQIQNTISKIDENILKSQSQFDSASERIASGDEDYLNQVKGRIHTNTFLTSLSKDFSEKLSHVKILENPLWKAIMEEQKFALDKWYKSQNINIEKRKAAAAERANQLTEQAILPYVQTQGQIPGEKIDFPTLVNDQYLGTVNSRDEKLIELAKWDMRRLGWGEDKITNWVKTQGRAQGKSDRDMMLMWGTGTYSKIKSGAITAPSELVADIENIDGLNNFISGFSRTLKTVDQRVKQESGKDAVSISDIMRSAKPTAVDIGTGTPVVLSPADQVDLARYVAWRREIFSTKAEDREREAAIQRLENKFGKSIATRLLGYGESQFATRRESDFKKVLNSYTGSSYDNYKSVADRVYGEVFSGYYPMNEGVTLNEKSRPIFQRNLAAMFINRPEFTSIKETIDDPNSQIVINTVPSFTGLGGVNQISMKVVGKGGKTTEPILMSLEQYQILLNKNPEVVNPTFALTRAIVNSSPDGSTNSEGVGKVETAFFGSTQFKNLTPEFRSRVQGADFVKDKSGADVYFPKIYYTPPNAAQPVILDIGAPMTLGDALSFPLMLDDNKLRNILLDR